MQINDRPLGHLGNEILDKILEVQGTIRTVTVTRDHWDGSGPYEAQVWPPQAFIVWVDERGDVQFGPVRWAHRGHQGQPDRWSASPFPGAWTDVKRDQILCVRHPEAL